MPKLLSTGYAAAFLGIGRTKLLALIRAGRIPSKMLDARIRIAVADPGTLARTCAEPGWLKQFLQRHATQARRNECSQPQRTGLVRYRCSRRDRTVT